MRALQEHTDVSFKQACAALGLSRASFYRAKQRGFSHDAPVARQHHRRYPPRKILEVDRMTIIDVLHCTEFSDQPPREIYGTLLSRGVYVGSVRTMYRVLATLDACKERRNQRIAKTWPAPSLLATGPNQVWTWDITKLRGPTKGVFYYAYVVIDLFSRYVVAWMVEKTENGAFAQCLFDDACKRHNIAANTLIEHSDRGSPMTCIDLHTFLVSLCVAQSFGRPRVSNDNAFSEAQFRTLKYQPDYPDRFASLEHARAWLQQFFTWYNDQHCHTSLALFTPSDVFFHRVHALAAIRQTALDAAYEAHPERFVHGRPKVAMPPAEVFLDPDYLHAARTLRCPNPPPEASVRPLPTESSCDGSEGLSRAAQLPSEARDVRLAWAQNRR